MFRELTTHWLPQFNVLSLNPYDPTSLPPELLDLLPVSASHYGGSATGDKATESDRLKRQMRLDALQPLGADGNDDDDLIEAAEHKRPSETALTSSEIIEEAKEFLQLSVSNHYVLSFDRQEQVRN